jgi:hypothetical protein
VSERAGEAPPAEEGGAVRTEADRVNQVIGAALYEDGYLRSDDNMAMPVAGLVPGFSAMRRDATAFRARATAPTGRDAALSFLKATVEDVNKSMAERMEAARTLLAHSTEGK